MNRLLPTFFKGTYLSYSDLCNVIVYSEHSTFVHSLWELKK